MNFFHFSFFLQISKRRFVEEKKSKKVTEEVYTY